MQKRVCLRRRDIKFIMFLGEYGIIANENVKMFYNSEYYYKNRLASLAKGEMIERLHGKVVLGRKGKNYLNKKGFYCRNINRNESYKKRVERISDITCKAYMAGWYFQPSWRCSINVYTQRGNRFVGIMSRQKQQELEDDESFYKRSYIVYFLNKDITPKELKYIDKEIDRNKGNFRGLIVFTENEGYLYKPKFEKNRYKESYIIPYDNNTWKVFKVIQDETFMNEKVYDVFGDKLVSLEGKSYFDNYYIKEDGIYTYIYYMPFANFYLMDYINFQATDKLMGRAKAKVVCLENCMEYVKKYLDEKVEVIGIKLNYI